MTTLRTSNEDPHANSDWLAIVSRSAMAQSAEPLEYQLGDAVLDAMRGALRILGGTVQMVAGMTRLLAIAVLKAAAAAEKAGRAVGRGRGKAEPKRRRWAPGVTRPS